MANTVTLSERLADHTRTLILVSAIELLEQASVGELTVRAVAARANISERTVFRYFASRDDFLDAVAGAVADALDTPPVPQALADLVEYPARLYRRFESRAALTKAALHTELFHRMRNTQARQRWSAIRALVDAGFPKRPVDERKFAAANIRYYLSATTWHYYRFYFGFSMAETTGCAQRAIRDALDGLARPAR